MVKADGSKLSLFELMIHLQRDLIEADNKKAEATIDDKVQPTTNV